MIVMFTCAWVTYVVIRSGVIPDLTGPTAFLTVGAGGHYLANNVPDIIAAFKGGTPPLAPKSP